MMLSIFSCLCTICTVSLMRYLFRSFAQFLLGSCLVAFKEFLVYSGCNYFAQSCGFQILCFDSLNSVTEQVFLILINSNLPIYSFIDWAFCTILKTCNQTGYTDFLLHIFLGVLQFCILRLGKPF